MTFRDDMETDLGDVFGNSTEGFAEPATYIPKSGSSYDVNVIFDETYEDVDLNTQAVVMSSDPRCRLRTSDIVGTTVKSGDKINIRGTVYSMIEPMPDGIGCTIVRLMV